MRAFCDDPEVDAFFDHLSDNPPVHLDFWTYGEAPYNLEFDDPELMLQTARALETVMIGDVSAENPYNVADAGGNGLYFELEDGSEIGFSFEMGCFQWGGSGWHDVDSFGDLRDMMTILHDAGYHTYTAVYADDDGFYTEYYDLYETAWEDEDDFFGGIRIYPGENRTAPFVSVRRILGEDGEPQAYLEETLLDEAVAALDAQGVTLKNMTSPDAFTNGHDTMAGVTLDGETGNGTPYSVILLIDRYEDDLMSREVLVQFTATYHTTDEEQKTAAEEALDVAVEEFHLKHYRRYEKGNVQTGEGLIAFCNDERITEWYENALMNPPEHLDIRLPDRDIFIADDPDAVLRVLKALDTVRLGGKATETVGASEPRYFVFIEEDSGDYMEFMFNKNQFRLGAESCVVEDWGDLEAVCEGLR